jgi:hypothetical protein
MKKLRIHVVFAVILIAASWGVSDALAQAIECASPARNIAGVTDPASHVIVTKYQFDTPNLQPLLKTTINAERGCLVAHMSGLARITDNYVVFQVSVDGVPMMGHLSGVAGVATPVVFVTLDEGIPPYNDEQFSDPTKVVAYNFFARVATGEHTVEVWAAAGSNIDPLNPPLVTNLVLTLAYP